MIDSYNGPPIPWTVLDIPIVIGDVEHVSMLHCTTSLVFIEKVSVLEETDALLREKN